MNFLKRKVSDTIKYWYVFFVVFIVVEILNYGVLSKFVPESVCFWLSAFMIALLAAYVYMLGCVIYDKVLSVSKSKEEELNQIIEGFKCDIKELNDKNHNLLNSLNQNHADITSIIQNVDEKVMSKFEENRQHISEFEEKIIEKFATNETVTKEIMQKMESGQANVEKLIAAFKEKTTVDHVEEIKKAESIIEQNSVLINSQREFEEKVIDKLINNDEANKNIVQKIESGQTDIEKLFNNIEEKITADHLEGIQKVESVIEQNALLINAQKEFEGFAEKQEKQLAEVGETISSAIKTASDIEIKELQDVKAKVAADIAEHTSSQVITAEKLKLELEDAIKGFLVTSNNELVDSIKTSVGEIFNSLSEFKASFETHSQNLKEESMELHSETARLLNLLVDNVEENSEKNEKHVNYLSLCIEEMSNKNGTITEDILDEIEKNKLQIESVVESLKEYKDKQTVQDSELQKCVQQYAKDVDEYYAMCFGKIQNLQSEFSGISQTLNVINNIYSLLQKDLKNVKDKNVLKEDNRIEEYKDDESGEIVRNHYKNNKIVLSEMIVDEKKTYEVQYSDDGKVSKSRNFNNRGEVILELDFYKSGQIKTRKEILLKGGKKETVTTNFDEKGNKIK